jgi:hypothetical protein
MNIHHYRSLLLCRPSLPSAALGKAPSAKPLPRARRSAKREIKKWEKTWNFF